MFCVLLDVMHLLFGLCCEVCVFVLHVFLCVGLMFVVFVCLCCCCCICVRIMFMFAVCFVDVRFCVLFLLLFSLCCVLCCFRLMFVCV